MPSPIRPGEELPTDRLESYLRQHLPELTGPLTITQFHGGHANLTYELKFGDRELVLRRPPFGTIAPGAHDMRREYQILSRLPEYFAPAPRALLLCTDPAVIGADFVVMERRHGVVVRYGLPDTFRDLPQVEKRLTDALMRVSADLHRVKVERAGLQDLGKPAGFATRQLRGWSKRWGLAKTEDNADMDHLASTLAKDIPTPQAVSIVHGDLKFDNCQYQPGEPDRVTSVFDWDMATLGDPLIDLAGTLSFWPDPGLDAADMPIRLLEGEWPDKAYVKQRYAEYTGLDLSRMPWYEAFACYKTAAIAQQLYHRYVQGSTRDERMEKFGRAARAFARLGWEKLLALIVLFTSFAATAQNHWQAEWITHPTAEREAHGVYYFRKVFAVDSVDGAWPVHVSGDNRYELYVNGQRVMLGPAWGDLYHWNYATLDLAPHLRPRQQNVIVARVVNFGHGRAVSQLSYQTGFVLQGTAPPTEPLSTTADSWQVARDPAYRPVTIDWRVIPSYYASNPTDSVYYARHLEDWQWVDNAIDWLRPELIDNGTPRGMPNHYFADQSPWLLVPRTLPALEERREPIGRIRRIEGTVDTTGGRLTIPAGARATILYDHGTHTRGYPEFQLGGGAGATLRVKYAESLYQPDGRKGHRDSITGKRMERCYYDVLLPDGRPQLFRPNWNRVFRYLQLEVETATEPLSIDSLCHVFTAYPYQRRANFRTDVARDSLLFDIGWRTLRNGTAEVFEDGPYYEQLMYAGDGRTESLVSLYLSGDERMSRRMLTLFDQSRQPGGLTLSRYPTNIPQLNPQYSLCWVLAVHDYATYTQDTAFVRQFLPGIRGVLDWFESYRDPTTGMLAEMPFLRHIENRSDTPRHPERGQSAQQTLLLALALERAAELHQFYGLGDRASELKTRAAGYRTATYARCWVPDRGLLADTPAGAIFTEHANVLGILTEAIPPAARRAVMERVLTDTGLVHSYLFFKYYTFAALDRAGLGGDLLDHIGDWQAMLNYGFTTFPEFDRESRSDCHPWSTHLLYHYLTIVAGVRSTGLGFPAVRIAPQPGERQLVEATVPHPLGDIYLMLDRSKNRAIVELPRGLPGNFHYAGREWSLRSGRQVISW